MFMYDLYDSFNEVKVAVYARVSSEHEEQLSALDNQIDWYKGILDQHKNWKLVEQYVDEGITGTSAEKRPEFMRMMADAKKGNFKMIITREVSRFARNTVDTLQYTRMLQSVGVNVYFINDGINTADGDGELRLTIMATLAQEESRKTSIRVKAGQKISREKGVIYGTGNILGYDKVGREMVINPEQAETVRIMFQLYLKGLGLKSIKYELERQGRKTAMGKDRWYEETIAKTLSNPFYCGIIRYGNTFTPSYLEQKKEVNNGQFPKEYVQGKHEPIISTDDFAKVQKIMASRRQEREEKRQERHMMVGECTSKCVWNRLLRCQCGAKLNRHYWYRHNCRDTVGFQCYKQLNLGTVKERKNQGLSTKNLCKTPMMPQWKLEMMAVRIFNEYISNTGKVVSLARKVLEDHYSDDESTDSIKRMESDITNKESEIERLNRKYDSYIEMRSEGVLTKEKFLEKTVGLKDRVNSLKEEVKTLKEKTQNAKPIANFDVINDLKKQLDNYIDTVYEDEVPECLLEAFIERVIVCEDHIEWYLRTTGKNVGVEKEDETEIEKIKRLLESVEERPRTTRRLLIASFTIDKDDAIRYLYSISTRRRIYRWNDIVVQIYV